MNNITPIAIVICAVAFFLPFLIDVFKKENDEDENL